MEATTAGSACGSCRPELSRLLAAAPQDAAAKEAAPQAA